MIRLSILAGAAVLIAGCTSQQQAALQAPAVWNTVTSPGVSVEAKACTVLNWAIPIAQERAAALTPTQRLIADGAIRASSAYCGSKEPTWQGRAVAAADEISKVLWDVIK
jgi:hypothetical protein